MFKKFGQYLKNTYLVQEDEEPDDLDFQDEFLPIKELPEGITVLLHTGSQYWYGYVLGDQVYRFSGEPYTGIVSPYEFRRLTEYEEQNLGGKS